MIELAQHIESLLLENDCVIVPGLGGFVAHYTPSSKIQNENTFLPPQRIIGFNPRLKMNDGLLVQSYAAVYGTDFSDATRMIEHQVSLLLDRLHEQGKVDLPNIGELHYSIYSSFSFTPYDHKLTTPYLYGMESVEMLQLSDIHSVSRPQRRIFIPEEKPALEQRKITRIPLKRSYLSNAVAMIAVAILFFMFSTPLENTKTIEENYAHLLPEELFEKIGSTSLLFTPVKVSQNPTSQDIQIQKPQKAVPVVAKEVKVKHTNPTVAEKAKPAVAVQPVQVEKKNEVAKPVIKTPKATNKKYHIIVASVSSKEDAYQLADQLNKQGHKDACAIIGNGKMRVSIQSFAQQQEAYNALNQIRNHAEYKTAWILKQNLSKK